MCIVDMKMFMQKISWCTQIFHYSCYLEGGIDVRGTAISLAFEFFEQRFVEHNPLSQRAPCGIDGEGRVVEHCQFGTRVTFNDKIVDNHSCNSLVNNLIYNYAKLLNITQLCKFYAVYLQL